MAALAAGAAIVVHGIRTCSTAIKKSIQYGHHTLTLETGEIARQAGGAVLASLGDSVVLVTCVAAKTAKAGQDFFPLTVDYQEKTYAAGKIPGGFFKREGRPSEKETLTSRLIDRPMRPLFPEGFYNEVQIVATVMSVDPEIDPDIPAMIGASAAVALSGIPFAGPIGAARVGYLNGQYVLNPTKTELTTSQLDLVVAGTEAAVLMVESEAHELPEEVMLGAVVFGHQQQQAVIELIHALVEEAGKPLWDWQPPAKDEALIAKVTAAAEADLRAAYQLRQKQARQQRLKEIDKRRDRGRACPPMRRRMHARTVGNMMFDLEAKIVRHQILAGEPRIDGRDTRTVRPITIRTGVLPRTHGSALFTRGETQALVVGTLGTARDEQIIDALMGEYRDRFMFHYNMPAVRDRRDGPRRLAQAPRDRPRPPRQARADRRAADGRGVRVLDARRVGDHRVERQLVDGVGVRREPRADGRRRADQGARRGHRDGPHQGRQPLRGADRHPRRRGSPGRHGLQGRRHRPRHHRAADGHQDPGHHQGNHGGRAVAGARRPHAHPRLMQEALPHARTEISQHAPRMITFKINPEKIRDVIGKGGAVIRALTEETGCTIDIKDDGTVTIASVNADACNAARKRIEDITAEVEVGRIYEGPVLRLLDFGAIVQLLPGKDGLLHISQIAKERVNQVSDYVKEGQIVRVKVIEADEKGRVRLSMKAAAEEDAAGKAPPPRTRGAGDGRCAADGHRGIAERTFRHPRKGRLRGALFHGFVRRSPR